MKADEIRNIAVFGGGVMGHGIAMTCARAGYNVSICDVDQKLLDSARKLIEDGPFGLQRLVEKGRLTAEEAKSALERITYTTSPQVAVREAQIVIEAILENADIKRKLFSDLETIVSADAILATNTSTIMITELASPLRFPNRFVGMHWFSPAQVMRLIEIIKGALTSEETCSLIEAFSLKLGKVPVRANDGPGFFTTRFISAFLNEAFKLYEQGIADIKSIDKMCKLGFGFPMGPFELSDLTGLDTNLHCLDYLYGLTDDAKYKASLTLRKLVMAGYTGDRKMKSGSRGGWYDYYGLKTER